MSKRKNRNRRRSFPDVPQAYKAKAAPASKSGGTIDDHPQPKHRDGIEQLIIAIILAVLFRSFEAEAFIIPTGSMAPTLQGKHKDVKCPKCRYRYRAGVADGRSPTSLQCPTCSFAFDTFAPQDVPTYSGDRILVNKFAYQFGDPKRWDVIVFKNPSNAKQNYIKRLVGLPNEKIRIRHGDVFAAPTGSSNFEILSKPPHKVRAMLQLVHDTKFIPAELVNSAWPTRWFDDDDEPEGWTVSEDRTTYRLESSDSTRWLKYRHLIPSEANWRDIERGKGDASKAMPELVTDHYAYNAAGSRQQTGVHWVGDLAVQADFQVSSDSGSLTFKLIEGGHHFAAEFDIGTGQVVLTIDDGQQAFLNGESSLSTTTRMEGSGKYKVLFANVDNRLLLWVNGKLLQFASSDDSTGFQLDTSMPKWAPDDAGDLNPVRIGGTGIDVEFKRLRLHRDIYYIACKSGLSHPMSQMNIDYRVNRRLTQRFTPRNPEDMQRRRLEVLRDEVIEVMRTPRLWEETEWFASRDTVEFEMSEEQYFPMGDNAPRSQDARLWAGPKRRVMLGGRPKELPADYPADRFAIGHFVPRSQLIGKAFLIYWPHGWPVLPFEIPVLKRAPIIPNVARMGRIK